MSVFLYLIILFLLLIGLLYTYWRFLFFFRDPERKIPDGDNIVSPADGTIVYIKKIDSTNVPISIKNKKEIKLDEIFKGEIISRPYYLGGIFMHPTSVHVNRSPISGIVKEITYMKANNLPMTMMWLRVLLKRKPYELYSKHIFNNERNTIYIEGEIPVYVTQIADIYVNKIECWLKKFDKVEKGQRFGMIKMGSQVDFLFPILPNISIKIEEGEKVKAGETIIAIINKVNS